MLIHPVGEVLAGDADAAALPPLQLPLVNERPLLHADLCGSPVLLLVVRRGQGGEG